MKIVCSAKAAAMLPQFFDFDFSGRIMTVKEGETLSLGNHTLQFFMAPMVHWPEVMTEYEQTEKILFSADGFGKFGIADTSEGWDCEARRYYFNIVGKYGMPVQTLLKKASSLDIKTICPLHGPVLTGDLSHYIECYKTWSSYEPEEKGVFIAYASIHGNTAKASLQLADMIKSKGEKVVTCDLTKCRGDVSGAVEDAFRYDRMIVASSTYDGGIFPVMEDFLSHLKSKAYQKRTVAVMENGSWAPLSGKLMKAYFEGMKDINILDTSVTIKSTVKADTVTAMQALAENICK
jgi:flavorubredoxin